MGRQFRLPVSTDTGLERGRIFVRNFLTDRDDFPVNDLSGGPLRINFPFEASFISISATGGNILVKYLTADDMQDTDASLVNDLILDGESLVFPAMPCYGVILDSDVGAGDQVNNWRLVIW